MKQWLGKIFDLLTGDGGFLGKILDKLKMNPAEKRELEAQLQRDLWAWMQAQTDNFRKWVLDYEGRATDIPHWVLGLRSTVRPVLTYLLAALWITVQIYVFWNVGEITAEQAAILEKWAGWLFQLNLLSLGFWYGEKLLTRSGLVEVFKRPKQPEQ